MRPVSFNCEIKHHKNKQKNEHLPDHLVAIRVQVERKGFLVVENQISTLQLFVEEGEHGHEGCFSRNCVWRGQLDYASLKHGHLVKHLEKVSSFKINLVCFELLVQIQLFKVIVELKIVNELLCDNFLLFNRFTVF